MSTQTTPALEAAFSALKKRCDASEIFSDSLTDSCEAEIAFIHSITGGRYEQADEIAEAISNPSPIRTLSTHPECCLSIFSDGSLFDRNNAQSEVWCDASDFLAEKLDRDELTLGEREFFEIKAPADDIAADFVVNIRRFYHGVSTSDSLARSDDDKILRFESRQSADAWIFENELSTDELYRCAHNEYARPQYTVIACD